jgi:Tetratricopeptide repeat
MATSEIEKLERRYAENPQGLTFAPLAEVHRKNGDVARALELLRAGLELHPNYIPASIVLGRCHWDLGDLPAAESAFAHVLRLDDENVIALKSLADINERLERFGEAQRWLHRLVSVDRSNEEARQQLTRLETAKGRGDQKAEKPVAPSAAQDLSPVVVAAEPDRGAAKPATAPPPKAAPSEKAPLDLTAATAEPAGPVELTKPSREPAEAKSSTLEFLDTSAPAGKEAAQPAAPEEPTPVAGLISQEFVPPKESTFRLHPELTQEFVSEREFPERFDVETADEVELRSSGAAEFRVPNAAEDFMDLAARMNARDDSSLLGSPPAPEPPVIKPLAAERPPVPERPPVEPPVATPNQAPPGKEEAVPKPGGLKLVTGPVGEPVGSYAARDTKGQSVSAFFQALLAARPLGNSGAPASSASPPALAPTTAQRGDGSANPSPTPAAGQPTDGSVSFDDFFGSPAGGAAPLPKESGEPGKDDLDQFQSWLQNLKH